MKPELEDEERLTAYALGELEPAEAAAIEAQLANDPARRDYVAEVRATADTLTRELKDEERGTGLTETQKRGIAAIFNGPEHAPRAVPQTVSIAPQKHFPIFKVAAAVMLLLAGAAIIQSLTTRKTSDIVGTMAATLPSANKPDETHIHSGSLIEINPDGNNFRLDSSRIGGNGGEQSMMAIDEMGRPEEMKAFKAPLVAKQTEARLAITNTPPQSSLGYSFQPVESGKQQILGGGAGDKTKVAEQKAPAAPAPAQSEARVYFKDADPAKPAAPAAPSFAANEPQPSTAENAFGTPDAHFFRDVHGSDDAAGGGGVAGTVDEIGIGASRAAPGTGGGWAGENGSGVAAGKGPGHGSRRVAKEDAIPAPRGEASVADSYPAFDKSARKRNSENRAMAELAPPAATAREEAETRLNAEAKGKRNYEPQYESPKPTGNLGYNFTRIPTPEYPPETLPPTVPIVTPTGTEEYNLFGENGFKHVQQNPLSTFSLDVDTASYSNVRRFLDQNQMPPPEAVRIEELINYFPYKYDPPTDGTPFAVHAQVAECPWNTSHRLVKLGVKAVEMAVNQRPPSNLVFLVDVSGSMDDPKRLPLVKEGLQLLVKTLNANDRVAIVTYADGSGVALQSTTCDHSDRILNAIFRLRAGGSTNGGAGIQTAYQTALDNFITGGVNRVILATDGDFNVGVTDADELVNMIKDKAQAGVFLTAIGCGMGNYKDARLQKLADGGNGNYAYVDSFEEIRKVLVEQLSATLVAVAKDVKAQVEFNPAQAYAYRLIGYEKRALENRDFNDDRKDAGDLGAGHTVTALYEVIPAGGGYMPAEDGMRYQPAPSLPSTPSGSGELLTVKIRYKLHNEQSSKLLAYALTDSGAKLRDATADYKFAAAVAAFGMLLKHSPYAEAASYDLVESLANESRGNDEGGYRREFSGLVRKARDLDRR